MDCTGDRGAVRFGAVLVLVLLVTCAVYLILVSQFGIETEVVRDRYWKNVYPLFHGEVPAMEYPPFAIVFMAIPGIFADQPWTYNVAYVVEMLVFVVIGMCLVARAAGNLGRDKKKAMLVYTILILLMFEFVVDRYDIVPMVFVLGAFVLFSERRYELAFLLLALGTLAKLYPIIVFPLFVMYLIGRGCTRDAVRGTAVFVLTGAVVMAVFWLIDPEMATSFLGYHTDRPLQLESVAASVLYPLSLTGLFDARIQLFVDNSFGSDNLIGPVPDAVAGILLPLMLLSIVLFYIVFAVRHMRAPETDLHVLNLSIMVVLLLFMLVNKVFSAQYLIWIIPSVAMLHVFGPGGGFAKKVTCLTILTLLLTQLLFAFNAGYCGGDIGTAGMMLILIRNVVACSILYIVFRESMCSGECGACAEPEV